MSKQDGSQMHQRKQQIDLTADAGGGGPSGMVNVSSAVVKPRTYKQTSLQANIIGAGVPLLILAVAWMRPWHLPTLFMLTSAIVLPWRTVSFIRRKYTFFLLDFCYFANVLTIVFLLVLPRTEQGWTGGRPGFWAGAVACMYVTTEGPLAAAIFAWRCAWVLGSPDHVISVLIHVLPGLALMTVRYSDVLLPASAPAPHVWSLIQAELNQWRPTQASWWAGLVLWPLAVYVTWQLMYCLVVQVACRDLIRAHGYDTSYNSMARRAAKLGSTAASRFVRRGSITRRVLAYGFLQFLFTLMAMAVGIATCYSFYAALAWQVIKFALPLYWGVVDSLRAQAQARWE